jgi:hypothetical protein
MPHCIIIIIIIIIIINIRQFFCYTKATCQSIYSPSARKLKSKKHILTQWVIQSMLLNYPAVCY